MQTEQLNLDWHRKKIANPQRRGNIMLVSTPVILTKEARQKVRCVWPSMAEQNSKFLSRRIFGRSDGL